MDEHEQMQATRSLTPTPLRFVLIGHSVGSYICLKLRTQARFPVIQVINLFPTFQYLYEGLAPTVQWMIQPGLRHAASLIVGWVPVSWKRYLVQSYSTGLSEEARDVVASGFNRYSVLNNVLYMAKTEGQDIRELDPELIQPLSSTYFLYGQTDQYTPMPQIELFRSTFPEGALVPKCQRKILIQVTSALVTIAEKDCLHAFCVSPEQSVKVADLVSDFIEEQCHITSSP